MCFFFTISSDCSHFIYEILIDFSFFYLKYLRSIFGKKIELYNNAVINLFPQTGEDCVLFTVGGWYDAYCTDLEPFVCEFQLF